MYVRMCQLYSFCDFLYPLHLSLKIEQNFHAIAFGITSTRVTCGTGILETNHESHCFVATVVTGGST